MNETTMLTNADPLIRMALAEDITSEDISTNAVMREAKQGEVDLICKEDGIIAGLSIFKRASCEATSVFSFPEKERH